MAGNAALVDVRDLSVAFGDGKNATRVVKNVSFHVGKGEIVALVGESGSGKTVSAMSILQLLPSSASYPSGEILFEGTDILKANESQLPAAMLRSMAARKSDASARAALACSVRPAASSSQAAACRPAAPQKSSQ